MATDNNAKEMNFDVVKHLSNLAQIDLSDREVEQLTGELSGILKHVAKVSEVASVDVPATSHPIPLQNVYREDEVNETVLSLEEALQNAPEVKDNMFMVSTILGEEQ